MSLNLELKLSFLKLFLIASPHHGPSFIQGFQISHLQCYKDTAGHRNGSLNIWSLERMSPWSRRIQVYEKEGTWDRINQDSLWLCEKEGREGEKDGTREKRREEERREKGGNGRGREGKKEEIEVIGILPIDKIKSRVTQSFFPSSFPNTGCPGTRLELPCFRIMKELIVEMLVG